LPIAACVSEFRLLAQKFANKTNLAGGRGANFYGIIGILSRSFRALLGSGIYAWFQVYAVDLQFIKTYICISQTRKLHLHLPKQNN
jgi:hypothetical protein